MKFDLHSHTFYSDGMLSPADLLARAIERKVDVLAITDHDTLLGLAPARAEPGEHRAGGAWYSPAWRLARDQLFLQYPAGRHPQHRNG